MENRYSCFNFKIDVKHLRPIGNAEYNPGIFTCPECRHDLSNKNIIGFNYLENEMNINKRVIVILECPECFSKSYHHSSLGDYEDYCELLKYREKDIAKGLL